MNVRLTCILDDFKFGKNVMGAEQLPNRLQFESMHVNQGLELVGSQDLYMPTNDVQLMKGPLGNGGAKYMRLERKTTGIAIWEIKKERPNDFPVGKVRREILSNWRR